MTAPDLVAAKKRGERITILTAYDFTLARLLDQAGVDCLLVGDSLGMVVQGQPHCLTVTMDQMVYHTQMVARGARRSLVVADMPFLSYHLSVEQALRNAGRLVQEGGAAMVKLEGGVARADAIRAIVQAGIPVMGHVGLTPQSVHEFGGHKVQRNWDRIMADAQAVAAAGASAIVVECVPADLANAITAGLAIPTIGIGAGVGCDGQVLVVHDLLGLYREVQPKFVKRYADLAQTIEAAVRSYNAEVRGGQFPGAEHAFQ
ncbi:MAG TPA: 3-methyl-2-oxobutanoate hydroxymethyltransferase [Gemmatales bacterium]|nr:3-methyl-2-oxobutanoate hydroxymethyltransferase [Gemmatales bacterium]